MLTAYFDDSGTHPRSDIVVVGGLIGTDAQWAQLAARWNAKLAEPLPGKPPLAAFHLSHCQNAWEEFSNYTRPESDAITNDFREIIGECGLISTASAVDVTAWNQLIVGTLREEHGEALEVCAKNCLLSALKIAADHPHGDKVAVIFDQGIWTPKLQKAVAPLTYHLGRPHIASLRAEHVKSTPGLQAADMAATENYWHAKAVREAGIKTPPRPHLQRYLQILSAEAFLLDRPIIQALADGTLPVTTAD